MEADDKLHPYLFLFIHIKGKVFHIVLSPLIVERISRLASTLPSLLSSAAFARLLFCEYMIQPPIDYAGMFLQVGHERVLLALGDRTRLLSLGQRTLNGVQDDGMQLALRNILRFGDLDQCLTVLQIRLQL